MDIVPLKLEKARTLLPIYGDGDKVAIVKVQIMNQLSNAGIDYRDDLLSVDLGRTNTDPVIVMLRQTGKNRDKIQEVLAQDYWTSSKKW